MMRHMSLLPGSTECQVEATTSSVLTGNKSTSILSVDKDKNIVILVSGAVFTWNNWQ
jgi:hypothetical protein